MRWNEVEATWHDLVDQIVMNWPELAADQLVMIAGNQAEFIRYIASRYDLTSREAEEVVEVWLMRPSTPGHGSAIRAA